MFDIKRIASVTLFVALLLGLLSCQSKRVAVPETSGVAEYARYFDLLQEEGGWAIVSLSPYDGAADTLHVAEPMGRIVCMSTSHVGFLDAIGADSTIVAVSGCAFVSSPRVQPRIADGEVLEAGYDAAPSLETLVALQPDVVLTYSLGDSDFEDQLRALGLRVFTLYEHLESHPLARAEYVRLFGALTGRSDVADSLFATVRDNYVALAIQTGVNYKVLLNLPYAGQWFIPGAESYMAQLIRDAGGEVLGAEPGTAQSSVISIEKAYQLSLEADFWLNAGSVRSLDQLVEENAAFASFPVARHGRVFTNDRRSTPAGGNDFWESGAVRPDLILSDLVSIFAEKPDSLEYYRLVR